ARFATRSDRTRASRRTRAGTGGVNDKLKRSEAMRRGGGYTTRMRTSSTPFPGAVDAPIPPVGPAALLQGMKAIVGNDNVLTAAADMAVYECDGFTIAKTKPNVVVFPTSTEHIVGIVKLCNELGLNFIARGAGTSLAGGCVLVGGGVMIALA